MRARLVTAQVALQVVVDDGETLTPIQLEPITLTAAQWEGFDIRAALAGIQAQLDQAEQETQEPV